MPAPPAKEREEEGCGKTLFCPPSEWMLRIDCHGCDRRKNKFPVGEVTVMLLFVPSSEMVKPAVDQLAVARFEFCCSTNPVEGEGHETFTLVPECVMVSVGAPAVCRREFRLQKPLVTE